MTEPDIVINGVRLSVGQSMALRVAATDFHRVHGFLGVNQNG